MASGQITITTLFRILPSLLLITAIALSQYVFAASYEEGKQAFLNKDYARALEILRPLAEEGNSQAQITLG